jgi:hypothetical protein
MSLRATGLIPDRAESRAVESQMLAFRPVSHGNVAAVPQSPSWLRDQPMFGCCAGQCIAACIDAATGQRSSGVSIWRDARRRQGRIEQIDEGTRLEYAIESVIRRGWDSYREGEDTCVVEAGRNAPPAGDDLADELEADDNRQPFLRRYRIATDIPDAVASALAQGLGVILGAGTREAFHLFRRYPGDGDPVLGIAYVGGTANGHGMRVVTFRELAPGRRAFLIQNSWGRHWGGCHAQDGTWLPGCCWVDDDVLRAAWDVYALDL